MGRTIPVIRLPILILIIISASWACREDVWAADQRTFVLCYHSFLGNKRVAGDVSIQELGSHMEHLRSSGFRFIAYTDFINGTVRGSPNILVVIDDGHESVYRAYRQVFSPMNIKPVLAVYPAVIGKKRYALTWERLRELSRDGCTVAVHGYYHLMLNQDLYDKDPKGFIKEIYASRKVLEEKLNTKISAFVYPNGVYSDITKETVKEAGYLCAFTIRWGPLSSPLRQNENPYEISRYMVYENNWGMISNSIVRAAADDDQKRCNVNEFAVRSSGTLPSSLTWITSPSRTPF